MNKSETNGKRSIWIKWVSLAACLCLIIIASVIIIQKIWNNQVENADKITSQGVAVNSSAGSLTLIDNNSAESKCTFTLTKVNDKAIYFCFRGFSVLNIYTDKNGVECKEVQQYHIITPYNGYDQAAENHTVMDDKLIITINGETVDSIPTTQGTYEITIDYSALYEFLDYVEPTVEVYSFGSFAIESQSISN